KVLILPTDGQRIVDGVVIPDSAQEDCRAGVVVALGTGYVNPTTGEIRPLHLNTGDRVIFGPYAGIPINLDGQEFLVMEELEVSGRVKDGSTTQTKSTS